ncbi:MAG: class F sortase [Actinomycetota bacterium]|nr:class F sortase [Actinomycetota bacterium]
MSEARIRTGPRRLPGWVLVGLALLLFLTAGAVTAANWPTRVSPGTVPRLPVLSRLAAPPTGAATRISPAGRPAGAGVAPLFDLGRRLSGPVRPVGLVIPRFHVEAPVVTEPVSAGGSLGVPDDPMTLGWWSGGPEPGAPEGTSVIDGHVDSANRGRGALVRLQGLSPGDPLAGSCRALGGGDLRWIV